MPKPAGSFSFVLLVPAGLSALPREDSTPLPESARTLEATNGATAKLTIKASNFMRGGLMALPICGGSDDRFLTRAVVMSVSSFDQRWNLAPAG